VATAAQQVHQLSDESHAVPEKQKECVLRKLVSVVVAIAVFPTATGIVYGQYLSHEDLSRLPRLSADATISYGSDSAQYGELRIPEGQGPHPVGIVIHGGCWLSIADLHVMDHFCHELTKAGIATWNLEYRRVDSPGGGWPATFEDISKGIDHIRILADEYNLDLSRVVVIGHSSGGHLALWAGARHRVEKDSELYQRDALVPNGVVSLAGPADLQDMVERVKAVCGGDVINALLGGSISEVPDRYRNASPAALLPTGVKQIVVYGSDDPAIPPELGRAYIDAGNSHGEKIGFVVIPNAAHFELIAPWTASWLMVEASIKSLVFVETDNTNE